MNPDIPQPVDNAFENIPAFWESDFGFVPSDVDISLLKTRITVRAYCFDEDGNVSAVQGKRDHGCYYIPGGGVEDGETLVETMKREALEESGDVIEDLVPVARFLNRLNVVNDQLYDVYLYSAKIAKKGHPTTTQEDEHAKEVIYISPEEYIALMDNQYQQNINDSQALVTRHILKEIIMKKV